jgi:ABC-2 type transport system ATP-binding protein
MMIIDVQRLSKTYEHDRKRPGIGGALAGLFRRDRMFTPAVQDISFSVAEGELVGFLGPNGAGKTTTLKILSGILYPTSGEVRVLGHVPFRRKPDFQKRFALVMGNKNQLWWDLPARESFLLNKEIYEISDRDFRESLEELAGLLDIGDILEVPVRRLSLGQRMKCELVAALIHRPRVLLLDEPTIGLDLIAQKNIRDFIERVNRERRTTILLTSHYMEDISRLCRRVIIITRGEIVYDGLLEDLVRRYARHKLLTVTFPVPDVRREDVERYGEIAEFTPYRVVLRIARDEVKRAAAGILASSLPVDDILIHELDVEDVIRGIYAGNTKPG